jgi:hypothetical protein
MLNSVESKVGTFCLISTKTIRQGDTRESSLLRIRNANGQIYYARRRLTWPGKAAVVIAIVAISRKKIPIQSELDGESVSEISSFLIESSVDETPITLASNKNKSFLGSKILGMGFTFDDSKPSLTSIERMHEIMNKSPKSTIYIKPYIGGEQVNNQASFSASRYVIDFGELSESQARLHSELWEIVEQKVKPERMLLDELKYPRRFNEWWKHGDPASRLYSTIADCPRVLVANRAAAKYLIFSFVPANCVYADSLYVFSDSTFAHFAIVQSRVHELWARMFGTSMKDDLTYTGTKCYENYPFPEFIQILETSGQQYNDKRSATMMSLNMGLTKLSNRLNSPGDTTTEILHLRNLHAAMDRAVLEAYGWGDIVKLKTNEELYEFSGDFENDDGSEGSVRLNFTEEIRDEILRRLLALHAERFEAEQSQPKPEVKKISKPKPKKPKPPSGAGQSELF